jgi:hypothetical protein
MAVRETPIGTLHRARKWWSCAVCVHRIAPGNRYWRIGRRRWCAWCALLSLDIAPEDGQIEKDITYPWEHAQ